MPTEEFSETDDNAKTPPAFNFVERELKLPEISLGYRLSLLAVGAVMILLPLIYLGLAVAVAGSVFFFAAHAYLALGATSNGPFQVLALFPFYVAPLVAGILLTLVLIKPLFAPRRREPEVFSLEQPDAPELFALIGWICRSLQAPLPSRVDLSCGVNAGARLRGGLRRRLDGDIVLSIGLPLAAGLNASQLAGVIAHEYGHLSRGKAMRADYFIQQINRWFYDAVYEPDVWDLYLREKCDEENQEWLLVSFLYVVRAGIALGRAVLWVLLMAGNVVSSFLSRQMEFDADQYELKISGSETFISTTQRLQQLSLGLAIAQKQMVAKWKKERKLFDRIPDYIVCRANEISADAQEQFYARVFRRKTGLFDQQPSDAERTERARAAKEPGVFRETRPATALFADYPGLSRRLTLFFYRDLIGPSFSESSLVALEQKPAQSGHDYATDRANIHRHFLSIVTDLRPLLLAENKSLACRPQNILREEILVCRRQMLESLSSARAALAAFTDAETRLAQAEQAAQLLAAGFQFEPADFGMSDSEVETAQREARAELKAADAELALFEAAGKLRLLDAVQLLPLAYTGALIPGAIKLQDEARELIHVLSRLGEVFAPMLELRQDCATLEIMLTYRRSQPAADNAAAALENLGMKIQESVNALQERLSQIRYPFEHETAHVMLSEFVRNKEYHADPFELLLREGKSHTERLLEIYNRLLGNLVVICERVESQIAND